MSEDLSQFDQEVLARQRDSFQGTGEALQIASYLLSRFKRPCDLWRFAEAKFANFDTAFELDGRLLLSSGLEFAMRMFSSSEHHLKEQVANVLLNDDGNCRFTEDELSEWKEQGKRNHPGRIEDEPLQLWIDRAIAFQCFSEGRRLLDELENRQPNLSPSSLRYLARSNW